MDIGALRISRRPGWLLTIGTLSLAIGPLLWLVSCTGSTNSRSTHVRRPGHEYRVPNAAATTALSQAAERRGPDLKPQAPLQPVYGPRLNAVEDNPTIRIRVNQAVREVQVDHESSILIGPAGDAFADHARRWYPPIVVRHEPKGFVISDGDGRRMRWALDQLQLAPSRDESTQPTKSSDLRIGPRRYPGTLVLAMDRGPRANAEVDSPASFDVMNYVRLERYLPGVLEKELYPDWPAPTYRAQAVAARSYALWERRLRRKRQPGRLFDLEASQASQVYHGSADRRRAVNAVRSTRGIVLGYEGRVVPAFFSSACGGRGQSASIAFADRAPDLAPLRGKVRGRWCKASDKYRWGPVSRSIRALSRRLRGWGRANADPIAKLARITRIGITKRSRSGRPARFGLIDSRGNQFLLAAEDFRMACNAARGGVGKPDKADRLYSSDVQVTISGSTARFTAGRGFGHGVGLCQWGAKSLASAGYSAAAICRFYYPEASLKRIY